MDCFCVVAHGADDGSLGNRKRYPHVLCRTHLRFFGILSEGVALGESFFQIMQERT